jgi:zinc/manganese transport system substrate-binding protein
MKKIILVTLILCTWCINIYAVISTPKKLNTVTTIPVLKALAQSIGGDLLLVSSLSTANEDPHFIKPRPTFKKWLNDADFLIYIGRDLEPWLNDVLRSSNNKKLTGYGLLKASTNTKILEIPSKLTRDMGDIHKEGNPHVWLSPSNALIMAENIKNSLSNLDPKNKATYENNFHKFKQALAYKLFGADLVTKVPLDLLFKMHAGKVLHLR